MTEQKDNGSRFNATPSPMYLKAKAALEEACAAGEDIEDIFGEVESVIREARFKEVMPTLHMKKEHHICFGRLAKGRCESESFIQNLPAGSDHLSEWVKNRRTTLIVSQPYNLDLDQIEEMVRFARQQGLYFRIDARNSWHFPGATVSVRWTKATDG